MRKMKVLILANNDLGLYKFRREVIEALLNENKVYICVPYGGYVKKLVDMGCTHLDCEVNRRGTNPLQDIKLMRRYFQIINQFKPDIVFTYTIKPNVYGGMVCALKGIPYVTNITGLGTAVENPGMLQKLTLTLYRFGLRKAQKVFFQNSENREFLLENKVVKGEYDLLPGSGVNLEQYQVQEFPKGETVDFAFIARVMKEKGIDQFLDAAIEIRKKYPETKFHICGFCEQNYEKRLKELCEKEIIIYHGLVDDITVIHKISQCTIHPTYYPEGLSNVLLESAACGRAIITTGRSGCREVVDEGKNGFTVRQQDSEDLIRTIERFLNLSLDDRKNMGLAGRQKVEKEFDRKIVIEKYLKEVQYVKMILGECNEKNY